MEYNKLVSVTGMSGLYELLSSKADGGVVRSLEDKSTKFVSTRIHNFSHLESIEVYTVKDNVNLVDVFQVMQKSSEALPEAQADAKAIKAYFEKVYPDMDFSRVYGSDMKKMVKWFSILSANNVDMKLTEQEAPATEEVTEGDAAADKTTEKKTEKKAEKKTTAAKPSSAKTAAVKNAPAKKINSPRKMA